MVVIYCYSAPSLGPTTRQSVLEFQLPQDVVGATFITQLRPADEEIALNRGGLRFDRQKCMEAEKKVNRENYKRAKCLSD